MSADELAYMSATEIAERIRARRLSPVEAVEACIARIEKRNPSLNAFVFKGFDDARREAKAAEAAVMSGAALGPLHGVPSAIKDLFDFKPGWPFTFGGVRAMKDCVAQWHCVFAERVEKAGAILLGKTNSPTMGLRGTCDNYLFGSTRIPSAWCNVVGFKASFGRVPLVMRPDAFAAVTPFVHEGPIARTVADARSEEHTSELQSPLN